MKILLVDDDREICQRIVQMLDFEEIEVVVAYNGLSAKRALEEDIFAAVVTDLSMPGMELLMKFRNTRSTTHF